MVSGFTSLVDFCRCPLTLNVQLLMILKSRGILECLAKFDRFAPCRLAEGAVRKDFRRPIYGAWDEDFARRCGGIAPVVLACIPQICQLSVPSML